MTKEIQAFESKTFKMLRNEVVVTRTRASRKGWKRKVTKTAEYWVGIVDSFVHEEDGDPELSLAAPRGRPKVFEQMLEGLHELRRAGAAEPD